MIKKTIAIIFTATYLSSGISTALDKNNSPKQSNTYTRNNYKQNQDRFAVAGSTQNKVKEFLRSLQHTIKHNKRKKLTGMVQYPLRINNGSKSTHWIHNRHQLLEEYNNIFTNKLIKIIKQQKMKNLFVNAQGIMFGNGQLWVRPNSINTKIKIIAINKETQAQR